MNIVLDGMGGDHAPHEMVKGAVQAAELIEDDIYIVGKEDVIRAELNKMGYQGEQIHIVNAQEVITMEEQAVDEEELWKGLKKALDGAVKQFVETRTLEGENLKKDLIEKLDHLLTLIEQIEERSPKIIAEYREKLENKVKELLEDTQIEESRIAAEVVIFADKICTDEEVVRLRSHVVHMKETLESEDSGIGRKLDFIAQEMNREANTILSKANDLEISNIGIELKTEIEKVREQIQNIE